MATSPETLAQVRDLLRKLDRSIDDARDRRLSHDRPEAPAQPNGAAPTNTEDPQAKPGRARPMAPRPDWQNGQNGASAERWTRPG